MLAELTPLQASLEQAFMQLTGETVEYHATSADHTDNDRAAASRRMSATEHATLEDPRARRGHARARNANPRNPLGVDEALVAALDPLDAAGRGSSEWPASAR